MAADQRKRRLNGTNIVGGSSQEKYRATKKHLGSTQSLLNTSPHISLEWDENQKQAVAVKNQICISRRALTPFDSLFSLSHNILADVCTIPSEIFELDNLAEVLSYEVWKTSLSSTEMNLLMQFLPKGLEVEEVLQSLLSGDNLHFGNPFIKWSTSLCSGNLHPDAVLQHEKSRNASKRVYYTELQKYHDDMVGILQSMKETWESCKDPEKGIVQNIWRSRENSSNRFSIPDGYQIVNPEESLGATSESYSEATDEKACSSDNQIFSEKGREFSKSRYMEESSQGIMMASDDVLKPISRPSKVNRSNKCSIRNNEGDKFMSYVKITKKQFELLKNMKQSGKSIQSRSLNRILGDLDNFQVRPFEAFDEEELTNLHTHWLQLAKRDLPSAFANWRRSQSQRCQITNSLSQELKEKLKSLIKDEETERAGCGLLEDKNGKNTFPLSNMEVDVEPVSASTNSNGPLEEIESSNADPEVTTVDVDLHSNLVSDNENSQSPELLEYAEHLNRKDTALDIAINETFSPVLQGYTENMHRSVAVNHGIPGSPDLRGYTENMHQSVVVNHGIPVSSPDLRLHTDSLNSKGIAVNQGIHVSSPDLRLHAEVMNRKDIDVHGKNIATNHGFPICSPSLRVCTESLDRRDVAYNHGVHVTLSPGLREYPERSNLKDIPVNHGPPLSSLPDLRVCMEKLNGKDIAVSHGTLVTPQTVRELGQNLNHKEITMNHMVPVSSSEFIWSSIPQTLYNSNSHQEYTSSNGLPIGHPQILAENPAGLIDLESNLPEQNSGGVNMLPMQSSHDNRFMSFQNLGRSQPFQPFNLGQDISLYNHGPKQTGLGFQQAGNVFLGNNQLPLQLDPAPGRRSDVYHLPSNIQDTNMYSEEGRYFVPRDWTAINNVGATVTQSSHSNGTDLLRQNWYSGQPQGSSNWSGLENTRFPNSSIGNGSNNDESLFSVLAHCKELNSHHTSYDHNPTGSSEQQLMALRNLSAMNGIVSRGTHTLPRTISSLDCMSKPEASTTQATNDVGWVNLPPSNAALHDSTGRPFFRSWNR